MRYLFILNCFFIVLAGKLPSSINICHRNQPDLAQCTKEAMIASFKAFKNGYKELGLPRLEPFYAENIELNSNGNRQYSIQLKFKNVHIYGVTEDFNILNAKINLKPHCYWVLNVTNPVIRIEGDYELEANIIVPLKAHGKFKVNEIDLFNTHLTKCEFYERDGKEYMRFTNYTMNMQPARVVYDFKDLFPVNKQIETEILNTLNENSVTIFKEVKPSLDASVSKIFMDSMNIVVNQIPFDELFLP